MRTTTTKKEKKEPTKTRKNVSVKYAVEKNAGFVFALDYTPSP